MIKKLAVFIFLISVSCAFSNEFKKTSDAEKFLLDVVNQFSDKDFQGSLDKLKEFSFIDEGAFSELVVQATYQWPVIEERYGKKVGTEFFESAERGKYFVKLSYIVRFEKAPLIFETVLYRNDKGWTVATFYFHDKVLSLF